jgi:pimeloyl-ACP methyl ester carboxylesterase
VAQYIQSSTGRRPVVAGLSQGGLIAGLLAASEPQLVEAVVLMGIPADGFNLPPEFEPVIAALIASGADRYLPPAEVVYAVAFGWDPVTGQPTIGSEALAPFLASLRPDSTRAILEMVSPEFFRDEISPAWPSIAAPALVMDGATDLLVGTARATALFEALGSAEKELVILPRNTHVWFLEDNFHATMHEFRAFLAQF